MATTTKKSTKKTTTKKSTATKKAAPKKETPVVIEENAETTLEENTMENVETKTETMNTSAMAAKDAEIDALKAQLQQLQAMMMQIAANSGAAAPRYASEPTVTLVHLLEAPSGCTTHIELTTTTIDMAKFGEQRTLTLGQAEELAGKYRRWLDDGIIAFGEGSEELCKKLKIKSVEDYGSVRGDFVGKLATIDIRDLEDLFNSVGKTHKAFIVEYFKRKIIEGDARFMDVRKVELLNRLTDGAMVNTIAELRK